MRSFFFLLLVACTTSSSPEPTSTEKTTTPPPPPTPPTPPRQEGQCENFSLSYGPVTLPRAVHGEAYDVMLSEYADSEWRGSSYGDSYSLPPGLTLIGKDSRESLALRGTPTTAGSYDFTVSAYHGLDANGCSTMPDPHRFHLEID